jgi:cholesterol oxidase
VAQAAGVGGGSLTYSSVALEAPPSCFERGWPPEVTYAALKPHYDTVARVMNLQTLPDNQLTQRFKLAREAAEKLGHAERFSKVPLAVSFSPAWNYQLNEPFTAQHSKTFTNAQGQQQGTCIHLGNCDIGCDVRAKNTLDLNYLALAEKGGAAIRQSTLENPAVLAGTYGADYYNTVKEIVANSSPLSQGPSGEEMIQAVGTELNEAVAGTKSVDDALAAAQAAAEKIQG